MRKPKRILLTGGGSGGHILPNLAIASELKRLDPKVQLLYIGSRNPLDAELVRPSGIRFAAIFTGKMRRYFSWRYLVDPFLLLIGFFQSLWIVARFWPDVVFTKGGFVSVPVAFAAFILRRPIVLHESDSRMGVSNRIVSKLARTVCMGFPMGDDEARNAEMRETKPRETDHRKTDIPKFHPFIHSKVVFTGNPVRSEILKGRAEEAYRLTGFHPGKPVVLVMGGSQGAQQINDLLVHEFQSLVHHFQIIHITGKGKQTGLQDPSYIQFEYLGDELKHVYVITDLVVSRAGANSLYELALMRKPNVLIPLSNADQLGNAAYFQQQGGSVILDTSSLNDILLALWKNPDQMASMEEALGKLARPEAANRIAQILLSESKHEMPKYVKQSRDNQ